MGEEVRVQSDFRFLCETFRTHRGLPRPGYASRTREYAALVKSERSTDESHSSETFEDRFSTRTPIPELLKPNLTF